MGLLDGKRGLILGVANERSIAHGIAKAAVAAGAEVALTYQNERLKSRVESIAETLGAQLVLPCDVTDEAALAKVAEAVTGAWGHLDFLVHAVAFADREDLTGRFVDTSRDGFRLAMDVSAFSLVALCRVLEPLLQKSQGSPSVVTLTYYGSEKAVPNYNVMGVAKAALEASVRYLASDLGPQGIRVNAISAGPIKTLSAAGVRGLRSMLGHVEKVSPLRRNVTVDDVGGCGVYLISDLSAGMTGEVVHLDAGYHAVGMPVADS